jgi:hypothetical protein
MAYATSNPPVLVSQTIAGGPKQWVYSSVDADSLVQVSGYFSNGYDLGMRAGDTVMVIDNDASPIAVVHHVVVSATTTAVDLDDGVAVSGADSD